MQAKPDWAAVKQRFEAWWRGDLTESPLVQLQIIRDTPTETLEPVPAPTDPADLALNVDRMLALQRNQLRTRIFAADAYPSMDINLGPGSMALYLGGEPIFAHDTVWYKEVVHDWHSYPLVYDPDNKWWRTHYEMLRKAQTASEGAFYVNIPDIIENIDIIAAMRGPTDTCYDLMDDYEIVAERIQALDDLYFTYYDAFYDLLKDENGGVSYTAFKIWGPGKTAKVQCDFCAMMSPEQFKALIVPSLSKQCARLTNAMYHLDGKDAIKHLPALMAIPELNALQWTAGAGQPDGGDESWYPIYDQVAEADKSLWVGMYAYDAQTAVEKIRKLIRRYGLKRLYIHLSEKRQGEAEIIQRAIANGFK